MKTYSQAGQDLFVVETLKGLTNGIFVDIAAGDPSYNNNTYLLEKDYNWDGLSIEIEPIHFETWKHRKRKTKYLQTDAFEVDYNQVFSELLNKNNKQDNIINYLSLDLEPAEATFELLKILPLDKFIFQVITYEHDSYRFGNVYKQNAMAHLNKLGYFLIKEDILVPPHWAKENKFPFEDWYIHKSLK
jgi:hypothetical protein